MNIVVHTYKGNVVVRPDTTWKRGNDDFYAPEFVEELTAAPVFFIRICRANRSIAAKFAERYYDSVGCGLLLYPENLIGSSTEGFATACCLDRTTYLTYPEIDKAAASGGFKLLSGGEVFFEGAIPAAGDICKTIEEVSRFCYLRTGDYVAMELAPRRTICRRENPRTEVKGTFSGNDTLDFSIIF